MIEKTEKYIVLVAAITAATKSLKYP